MIDLETRFHQPRLHYSPYRDTWRPVRRGLNGLSKREFQIVTGIAIGKTAVGMAKEFGISAKCVWEYRRRAMQKLEVINNTALTHFLLSRGVVKNLFADEPNG